MKIFSNEHERSLVGKAGRRAMTIAEMMVSISIFGVMMLGLAYVSMFGMKVDQLTQSKLGASDQARRGFNKFADDVRAAKIWQIGNCTVSTNSSTSGLMTSFTGFSVGGTNFLFLQGNALKISLTTDTNQYIAYYFDTNQGKLLRMHSGDTSADVIARYLTNASGSNTMYFNNQNYAGVTNSTVNHKSVLACTLQFSQYQYPLTHVGAGFYYDSYRLSFKLTPHVPDGP